MAIGRRDALSRVPSAKEWYALYDLSAKQAVAGVCFCDVQRLPKEHKDSLPETLIIQWLALATQIQARNELMNRRCMELQRMLAEDGMRSSIMKGQGVATLYNLNLNLYREPGDIDVWADGSRERAIDYVMMSAPTRVFDQKHIHFHVFNDVDGELHWIPVKRNSPKFDRILGEYFSKESCRQFTNRSGEFCYPTIVF